MKKSLICLLGCLFMAGGVVSCGSGQENTEIQELKYTSYFVDSYGNLIGRRDDGENINLGNFKNDILNSDKMDIEVSEDKYYIINGIQTEIYAGAVYTVTFETNCEFKVRDVEYKEGSKIVEPVIQRSGYTLLGWFNSDVKWDFNNDIINENLILYAKWEANTYTVKFDTNGEFELADMKVTFDSPFEFPTLSKAGFTFLGWKYYDELINTNVWKIAYDVIVTPAWELNEYTISLDAKGGRVQGETKIKVKYGSHYKLPVASNSFGTFKGWFIGEKRVTDKNGNSLEPWTYLEDHTFTTSWEEYIKSVDDLRNIENSMNGQYYLSNDIDLTNMEWKPLGSKEKPFTGFLDGNGHSLKGLNITNTETETGLFASLSNAEILNINFESTNIKLSKVTANINVGILAGCSIESTIKNCTLNGNIDISNHSSDFTSYAGGLIGYSENTVLDNIVNNTTINAISYAGGLVGLAKNVDISNSINNANIFGKYNAGGLAGDTYSITINRCGNNGNISSENICGGITTESSNFICNDTYNKGNITSNFNGTNNLYTMGIGGILCSANTVEINNCYNSGIIVGNNLNVGGICNSAYKGNIRNCYNSGNLKTTNKYNGGIVAVNNGINVKQCGSFGKLNTLSDFRGLSNNICFININGSARDCIYTYNVNAYNNLGTLVDDGFNKDNFINLMFWEEYNAITKTGNWTFSNSDYPKLYWE